MKQTNRILYIDNLRVFLMVLVVLHHFAITYGASGGWYYKEVEGDAFTRLILTMFAATNQSFFMGLFFLISAYFTRISMNRKHLGTFLKERLVRLGIPLAFFYFVLSPITVYITVRYVEGDVLSLFEFVRQYQGIGFGPMWFVETLIYFTLIYVLYRTIFKKRIKTQSNPHPFPKILAIISVALGISLVSFLVRLKFPLGSSLGETGLQLPYFPQYIAMLIFGILFQKNGWFDSITYRQGVRWFVVAQVFVLVLFPLVFMFANNDQNQFEGGLTWQSALLCVWEQLAGFSLIIGLVGIFKQHFNRQGHWANQLSKAAYAVFIIHPVIIVSISILFKSWEVYPVLKFVLLAPIALISCFGIGMLLKKVPGVEKVL